MSLADYGARTRIAVNRDDDATTQLEAAGVGQIATTLLHAHDKQQPERSGMSQSHGTESSSGPWSFCAAPPLETYTGGWLDDSTAQPPHAAAPARSRKQAMFESLFEGMVVEGTVTAVEGAALLVRLRKVQLLSPGGSLVQPPAHLRHLWQLQLFARCDAAELADDAVSSHVRATHLLGRYVPGDNVRGVILRVGVEYSTAIDDKRKLPPPPLQPHLQQQHQHQQQQHHQQQQQHQHQQSASQIELSFRDTLVRALYAAGAPDLGLLSPSSPSHQPEMSSSSSDSEDDGGHITNASRSAAQDFTRGYGRRRKRKRSQPLFNSLLESEAVFANPYAVETMATSYGLGLGSPQEGSKSRRGLNNLVVRGGSNGSATHCKAEDTILHAFQRGRSFSFVLRNCAQTNGQTVIPMESGGDIPEYLVLRKQQNYTHAADSVARGVSCAKRGDYTGAMKHYSYALHIDRTHAEAYVARGAAYANQGMLSKAVGEFEHALTLLPPPQQSNTATETPGTHGNNSNREDVNEAVGKKEVEASSREPDVESASATASAVSGTCCRLVDANSEAKARTRANATLYLAATRKKLAEQEKEAAKEAAIAEEAARLKRQQQAEIAQIKARKAKLAAQEEARRRDMEKPIPAPSLASLLSEMKEKVSRSSNKKRKKEHKKKQSKKHRKKHRSRKKRKKEKKSKHDCKSNRSDDESDGQIGKYSDSSSSSSSL